MIKLDLKTLASAAQGQLIANPSLSALIVDNVITDSRAIKVEQSSPEQLETVFLALKGPSFDGHRFVTQVIEKGCQAVIVDHPIDGVDTDKVAQIVVNDTRIALGKIGAYVKEQVAPKTIGITGSSGKTTVKEMLAAILSRLGKVLATDGNFNNDIGVPLTLLHLSEDDDFAVIEMGANHIGEIAYTTELVKPDVAMINNIAAAHLEGFGDLCGVARAKGEIFSGLSATGVALYNKDTKYTAKWQWRLTDKQVRTFSCLNPTNADISSSNVQLDDDGCASFDLQTPIGDCAISLTVPGKHNVCNAVAAASAALECGASLTDIRLGLAEMAPVKGRLNIHQLGKNLKLIDDTYNANVESIKAAITLLANYSGQRILVLGDMAELGSDARSYHQEVGEYAKEQGIDMLFSVGVLSQNTSDAFALKNTAISEHFSDRAELSAHLLVLLNAQATASITQQTVSKNSQILVKGSRSAHMEYVVEDIISWYNKQNEIIAPNKQDIF